MTSKPQAVEQPGKPSIVRDGQSRAWRLCLKCQEYRLTEDSPLACSTCGVEYGKTEREPVNEQIELTPVATHRATLCENCGQGFSVLTKDWNPAAAEFCDRCKKKQREQELLTAQLQTAQTFGHTQPESECELCAAQNGLESHDWRDERDKAHDRLERKMKPLMWTPAGQ